MERTIRLLYPDYVSGGGIDTYYFGANLLVHILPENASQPLFRVDIAPPDGAKLNTVNGIYGEKRVLAGIRSAKSILNEEQPDRVITIGGTCMVSQAPFDYLHGLYDNLGIIWIDAHPDVSTPADGYPNAHAMVLGSLMGHGAPSLTELVDNGPFLPDEVLYVGLQGLHDYQEEFLRNTGVNFKVQTAQFVSDTEIAAFADRFRHVAVHLDIDVLDPAMFHSTYFANKDLVGDGSGGGRMTMSQLSGVLQTIAAHSNIVGFTIAEYLPFDEQSLHKMLDGLRIFAD